MGTDEDQPAQPSGDTSEHERGQTAVAPAAAARAAAGVLHVLLLPRLFFPLIYLIQFNF